MPGEAGGLLLFYPSSPTLGQPIHSCSVFPAGPIPPPPSLSPFPPPGQQLGPAPTYPGIISGGAPQPSASSMPLLAPGGGGAPASLLGGGGGGGAGAAQRQQQQQRQLDPDLLPVSELARLLGDEGAMRQYTAQWIKGTPVGRGEGRRGEEGGRGTVVVAVGAAGR